MFILELHSLRIQIVLQARSCVTTMGTLKGMWRVNTKSVYVAQKNVERLCINYVFLLVHPLASFCLQELINKCSNATVIACCLISTKWHTFVLLLYNYNTSTCWITLSVSSRSNSTTKVLNLIPSCSHVIAGIPREQYKHIKLASPWDYGHYGIFYNYSRN